MKLSEQWLREWVNPPTDTAGLAEQLTMAGLEVDGVEPCAPNLDGVVVAKVLEKGQHPNADRLSLCSVDAGDAEPLQIVCGAANVYAGGMFPVAKVGATLPSGMKIKKSKLRGEVSLGMLCSATELGIAESADGLLELHTDAAVGTPVADALQLNDQIIELDLTPNRADCFSVVGVARDVAAMNSLDFSEPEVAVVPATIDDTIEVRLDDPAACAVFAGRVIRNINPQAVTPLWMTERLRRSAIRPLHPIVDVTNYVMLELGQPMHAYDLGKLKGTVVARMAAAGEVLVTIDDQTIKLADDILMIADDNGPLGIAGIMGGAASAVSAETVDVFLESAFFAPSAIAGRARRLGLHTDASLRFERGVDFAHQVRAIERATALILEIAGGDTGPVVEQREQAALPARNQVRLRRAQLDRLLGVQIAGADVEAMFKRLGFDVSAAADGWTVTPTACRFDIAAEEDLIEEVVRLYGYDNVPRIPAAAAMRPVSAAETRVSVERLSALLVDRGYSEAITYSFVDPDFQQLLLGEADEFRLANPISSELSVMRRSLWPGLVQALDVNRNRQQDRVRLFESGMRFSLKGSEIKEELTVAGVVYGAAVPEQWARGKGQPADLFDVKSDLESLARLTGCANEFTYVAAETNALRPGRTARIMRGDQTVGWLGELHPRIARKLGIEPAPVLFELQVDLAFNAVVPAAKPVSRYPSVRRDLAVLVSDSVPAGELLTEARDAAGEHLRDIIVFDVYTGDRIEKGLKSVALGLILQGTSRTLNEIEIDAATGAVVERLSSKFNATIRE